MELSEFAREPRYVVFKLSDMALLSDEDKAQLQMIGDKLALHRRMQGKPVFNAVVVEQDWPEFDIVWAMIEARVEGKNFDMPAMPVGGHLRCPKCGHDRTMQFSYAAFKHSSGEGVPKEALDSCKGWKSLADGETKGDAKC